MNILKKTIIFTAVTAGVIGSQAMAKTIELGIDSDAVYVLDNFAVSKNQIAAPTYIENGRTMVPLRFISETLGAEVNWNEETREITISKDGKIIKLTIGSTSAFVGDEEKTLDTAPVIVNDITFVPVRFVSENLNTYVDYVEASRQVLISDEDDIVANVDGKKIDIGLINTLHTMYQSYEDYYGAENYAQMIYQDAIRMASIDSKWATINQNKTVSEDLINEVSAYTDDELAEYGVLKGYFAKILSMSDSQAEAGMMIEASLSDEDINKEYADSYVCAKHILIMTQNMETGEAMSDKDKKAAKTKAEKLLTKIKKGTDFDELMNENSEDTGLATNPDGYVFTTGKMVKPFEEAAFALKEDEVSGIVETDYGYHIIKRLALPEISDEIKSDIRASFANDFLDSLLQSTPVEQINSEEEVVSILLSK